MVKQINELISVASGEKKADLVLKNGRILNVFTKELMNGDVAIFDGYIAGIGSYEGEEEIDVAGKIICPGLIDAHVHIESSMLSPEEFAKAVIPHGTTAVINDPHEIANVAGEDGISYMISRSKDLPLDLFYMLPSCVPATPLDESGAVLKAVDLDKFYKKERVLGLAELMDYNGTVRKDPEILSKIESAVANGKIVDGHAPGLSGKELNAYVSAGVGSDHECSTFEEALEKLTLGQWIMIREGTAAKNLQKLLGLFDDRYFDRCMLVTDDMHPEDIIDTGHIDHLIREAVRAGKNPYNAVRMASYNAAAYFGLKDRGAVAPGYIADIIVVADLAKFEIDKVFKNGILVAENGELCVDLPEYPRDEDRFKRVYHSFNLKEIAPEDLVLKGSGSKKRVIELIPGEILTEEFIAPSAMDVDEGDYKHFAPAPGVETDKDIVKIAVIERHKATGHIGVGFVKGYGLQYGAIASSVAHDSHNIIVVGTNDADMALAANAIRDNEGGIAIAADGKLLSVLPLPIGGLMSELSAVEVKDKLTIMKEQAKRLGVSEGIDPFMTLGFASLPVIPKVRMLTEGLVDVATLKYFPVLFD